jgi:NitT/TauT family transport system substrate-binding protein
MVHPVSRLFSRVAAMSIAAAASTAAVAQEKVTFLTSWYAQAEHGGFYQALANGLYKKEGLDVTIRMGGPQVNTMQLLAAGQTEFVMSYDFSVLKALENGIAVTTVATSFQYDLQGLLTHDDVPNLASLKGKTILVATAGRSNWWPWMKTRFGYTDEQTKAYTFNLQPFFADKNVAQQAYLSSEPFAAAQAGAKSKFFLFAHDGYPPYGTTIVAMQKMVKDKPEVVQKFVRASMEGWKSYVYGDASP